MSNPNTTYLPQDKGPVISDQESEIDDDGCSDWASSLGDARRTHSLFDDSIFATPEAALAHDKQQHGFDLLSFSAKLGLDIYGRMKLINFIRKERPTSQAAMEVTTDKLQDESLLSPVIIDDPLLQLDFDDEWSDDEIEPAAGPSVQAAATKVDAQAEIEKLQTELAALRALVGRTLDGEAQDDTDEHNGKVRDDDTHYFDSYAENDIHEIMLKDTTRTVSYAQFIMSNPSVFKDAIVLDVGCGTAILSMLAARAGAKHVYAIEASGLATKARENVLINGLASVVTVIQSKVEDVHLPVDKVDIIISEWMGYMLLYESMLDSVLHARDRYLSASGLMAPSQTRLVISGITADRLMKERVDFWNSVYGFDMSGMTGPYFDEGLVEIVDKEEVKTTECIVRDINSHSATPQSLEFHSTFTITSTAAEKTTIRAFLTHFDTFFSPFPGAEASHVPPHQDVEILPFADDLYTRPVDPITAASQNPVSFTTGPRGQPTHWKQVTFLLRKPIDIAPGQQIEGQFFCRKSTGNSRELEVELHYAIGGEEVPAFTVQAYKVR